MKVLVFCTKTFTKQFTLSNTANSDHKCKFLHLYFIYVLSMHNITLSITYLGHTPWIFFVLYAFIDIDIFV